MTSTVQERLQLNRLPLDKWTTREQLCLASAVSCSGDQNWMSVSRTLKLVCSNNNNNNAARPGDWFSQKNCAVQYGNLLENVETPKRKKRSSESASGVSSPATVETPTDSVLRRLTEERVQELKAEMRKDQEEYAQIYGELKALQSGQLSEEQMLEMWKDIEKQQEKQRIEEMKLENQMREREQHRQEMQRNWRTITPATPTSVLTGAPKLSADTTAVDMDVEEIIGTNAAKAHVANIAVNPITQSQSHQTVQPGTSPLLSSLLKSPTATGNALPTFPSAISVTTLSNSARTTAPTITTLLTSGSIPNCNQPAITLNSSIPAQEAVQLLTRPISGPPTDASVPVAATGAQTLLSPSQAAPTLSMLLEKIKTSTNNQSNSAVGLDQKSNELSQESQKIETAKVLDSNNEEVPMDLEEDMVTHSTNSNVEAAGDSDEPDPNEEQQLLEVFKNIGNIDELDIDEEVDFLKGVDEESPGETGDVMDFDNNVENDIPEIGNETVKENKKCENENEIGEGLKDIQSKVLNAETDNKPDDSSITDANVKNKATKVETISSDDSNDNIPLAALEQKSVHEKETLKEKEESAIKNEGNGLNVDLNTNILTEDIREVQQAKEQEAFEDRTQDNINNTNVSQASPAPSENSDVIVIPTDDESSGDKHSQELEKSGAAVSNVEAPEDAESETNITRKTDTPNNNTTVTMKTVNGLNEQNAALVMPEITESSFGLERDAVAPPPPTISIADTDEDSSTTDISIITRKDERAGSASIKHLVPQARKSLHDTRHEQKTDDESNAQMSSSSSSSATLAKPPMLRKLRERDRSESPMIDSESPAAINAISSATLANEFSTNQRLRRRYSSTPVTDSIPNSPASSDRDDVENRASKKSLLSIYNALQYNKNANALQRALNENTKVDELCLRPMDMPTIKKNIEVGSIRTVNELQRDVMLVCQNGLMAYKVNSSNYKAANGFMQECQAIREFTTNPNVMENTNKIEIKDTKEGGKTVNSNIAVKARSGSRKSQRIS